MKIDNADGGVLSIISTKKHFLQFYEMREVFFFYELDFHIILAKKTIYSGTSQFYLVQLRKSSRLLLLLDFASKVHHFYKLFKLCE